MKLHPLHIIFLAIVIYCQCCTARAEPVPDSIWLARSCAGEAGLWSYETGECLAILHIYKKRAELNSTSIVKMAKQYSAAIKQRGRRHPNRWVLYLLDHTRPKYWPRGASWAKYRVHWIRLWFQAAMFLQGRTDDPLPRALHYGGSMDPRPQGFEMMQTKFRNRFYRIGNQNEKIN